MEGMSREAIPHYRRAVIPRPDVEFLDLRVGLKQSAWLQDPGLQVPNGSVREGSSRVSPVHDFRTEPPSEQFVVQLLGLPKRWHCVPQPEERKGWQRPSLGCPDLAQVASWIRMIQQKGDWEFPKCLHLHEEVISRGRDLLFPS